MRMENQAYAAFVRCPVAHARINGVDASAALAMAGVIAVHTGPELKADGIGDLIAGWAITSKDGTPMKAGAWSPLVTEICRYVGDAIAILVAETKALARQAAEAVVLDYEELPATVFADKALAKGAAELHANVPGNLIDTWEIGDEAATKAGLDAAYHFTEMDIVNNRLSPNTM